MRTRKKISLLIFILSLGLICLPSVIPADLLGGYWEQPECWVDYNYYYCDWFVVGKLDVVNETTFAQPEWRIDCYHRDWYEECFIPCEEVADMESLGGDILTYCLPPENECIREWAGAFCPAAIYYHGWIEYLLPILGGGLFIGNILAYGWASTPEEEL
jgi:hypothetical protein